MILAWPLPTGCLPLFWGVRIIVSRSAALLKLGHPNLALEDIAEAVKAGYPQDLTYKVKYFWEKCKVKNVYVWHSWKKVGTEEPGSWSIFGQNSESKPEFGK